MRFGPFRRAAVTVGAVLVLAAGGCSGSDDAKSDPGELEKTELNVGALPIIDDAPLFVAIDQGFFAAEGLTVKPVLLQSGSLALPRLLQGTLDVAFSNYVSVFRAQARGQGKFRVLIEGYQAGSNVLGIVATDPKIVRPGDLRGKTVAVNSLDSVGPLTINSALTVNDVRPGTVKFQEIPFQQMAGAVQRRQVDAAWMVEPYITDAAKELGARMILDTASGPTADWPVAGYVSTATFADRYPKTAAAFKRAMRRAQEVSADRQNIEKVLPKLAKIDPETAVISSIGVFPTSEDPSPVRLQRVADLMQQAGMLDAQLNVRNLTE
jgi:NitT/TauT family transport system substrate-binding protein